jgi:hypothetical protein
MYALDELNQRTVPRSEFTETLDEERLVCDPTLLREANSPLRPR